jgi:hypothetical protein
LVVFWFLRKKRHSDAFCAKPTDFQGFRMI